jgi:hypothetical protein
VANTLLEVLKSEHTKTLVGHGNPSESKMLIQILLFPFSHPSPLTQNLPTPPFFLLHKPPWYSVGWRTLRESSDFRENRLWIRGKKENYFREKQIGLS